MKHVNRQTKPCINNNRVTKFYPRLVRFCSSNSRNKQQQQQEQRQLHCTYMNNKRYANDGNMKCMRTYQREVRLEMYVVSISLLFFLSPCFDCMNVVDSR